jgi:hypothetical protein
MVYKKDIAKYVHIISKPLNQKNKEHTAFNF